MLIDNKQLLLTSLFIFAGALNPVNADDKYSLTISPFHLSFPVVELTLEAPLASNLSISGILGYGSITVYDTDSNTKFSIFEAGGQFRYYPGDDNANGFQLGMEAMYIKPSSDDNNEGVTVSANGFAIGPFVGYKWTYTSGIVLDIQLGYQRFFAQAKAKNSAGDEIDGSVQDNATMLNLNAGYAF